VCVYVCAHVDVYVFVRVTLGLAEDLWFRFKGFTIELVQVFTKVVSSS